MRLRELGGTTAAIVHLAADPLDELLFFAVHEGALASPATDKNYLPMLPKRQAPPLKAAGSIACPFSHAVATPLRLPLPLGSLHGLESRTRTARTSEMCSVSIIYHR